jgi:hypothetical protein
VFPPYPNVIIPGAQKAGTSSLAAYLAAHPQCALTTPREPAVFSRAGEAAQPDIYRTYFNADAVASAAARIDASTSYLPDPSAPQRIRAALGPQVKWIVLLRRPSDRAVSGYWHLAKRRHERRSMRQTFLQLPGQLTAALEMEAEAIEPARRSNRVHLAWYEQWYDDPYWHFRYLANSCYSRQLESVLAQFPRDQMLVILLDELAAAPRETYRRVTRFLGIDDHQPSELGQIYHRTRLPRGGRVGQLGQRLITRTGAWTKLESLGLDSWAQRLVARGKPKTPPAVARHLDRLFRQETERVAEHLNRPDLVDRWYPQSQSSSPLEGRGRVKGES